MRALHGIRVLELGNFMAGPFCSMLLGDLGADVVKVEQPGVGDHTRGTPPFVEGESAGFLALNRNKRSLTLNLKAPAGRDLFYQIAATADVLVENYRPGTTADLGIDEATLRARNPRLIYCSVSGFGQTGPYRERAGLDLILQGVAGLMSITGEPGRPPVKVGVPIADLTAALFAANAILAAIVARERTGEGQYVDVSLLESALALGVWETSGYFATGEVPGRLGSAHRTTAPYQAFRTRDGYITIGVATPRLWESCCQVLGLEHLRDDPRFVTNAARKAHEAELAALIEAVTTTAESDHWLAALDRAGVPCGRINTFDQILADPHLAARETVVEAVHPRAGRHRLVGYPAKLSATPAAVARPAPLLGEHTDEILQELGLTPEAIAHLREERVI